MKKLWKGMLIALLVVSLAITGAGAEMTEDTELSIVLDEEDTPVDQADELIPEEDELSLDGLSPEELEIAVIDELEFAEIGELEITEPEKAVDMPGEASPMPNSAPAARHIAANDVWNDADLPIIDTDVSVPAGDCVFLGLQGTYVADVAGALERINEIRLEACQEGVPHPVTGKPLTMADYRPIRWSSGLEYTARIRAAESAITLAHARLNGRSIWFSSPDGVQSSGEVIAWNWSDSMTLGIDQWYDEKADWVNHTEGAVTGHYTQMINPNNGFVGLGTFLSSFAPYYNTTVGRFSTMSELNETPMAFTGACIQKLEVSTDAISGGRIIGHTEGVRGDAFPLALAASVRNYPLHVFDPVFWTTSNDSVASADAAGIVTGKFCGSAVISARASDLISDSVDFTVHHIAQALPAVPATCTQTGLTAGSHCSVCNAILTAQEIIPAKGHKAVTDPAVPATCTQAGLTAGSHCSVCNAILTAQEIIPAKGHKAVTDPAVPATCTQTGLTEGSHCSVCGEVLVPQEVIPRLISIKKCKVAGIKDVVYSGKAIKPVPVVTYGGKKLIKGTDYTVKYADNKAVGTAAVTITGKGKYGESVKKTFKINPKPVTLSAVTPGSRQLTVKWKKGKGITGYEVQYGLKRSFASARKVVITNAATVKTVLKELKAKKKYYIRIRTYKKVKGKKYYSAWSKAKTATTKK